MSYQVCTRCVMDNSSDASITFDENGYCNYCSEAIKSMPTRYYPNEEGRQKFEQMVQTIKSEEAGKKYDCLMGISGGLDSSYLAYLGYKAGLRILAVHIDDGFDTEITKSNIRNLVEKTNIDILFEEPDPEQFYGVTAAFIKAGVPNIAIPQDNLIFAYLYKYAKKYDLNYFLSGGNFSMESILQRGNSHTSFDKKHIEDINRRFGKTDLDRLQITSGFERKIKDQILLRIKEIKPLDYIDYNKERAIQELEDFCGFSYYGGKHYESILTIFMQRYYLPQKFGVDKRRSHLSSLIVSGQLSREEALRELEIPLFNDEVNVYIDKLIDTLGITREELDAIMKSPPVDHTTYKVSSWKYVSSIVKRLRGY